MRPTGGDGPAASRAGDGPAATQAAVLVERRDGTTVVAVTGEVDLANADVVEGQVLQGVTGGPAAVRSDTVVLDLTGLDYIDSAGLWILFRLGTRLRADGVTAEVLVPGDGPVRRMVETAGVSAAIAVRPVR